MKPARTISLILVLAVMAGQVQYSYTYCAMMKHAANTAMLQRCISRMNAGETSRVGQQVSSPRGSLMRLVSKGTTDSFERHRSSSEISIPLLSPVVSTAAVESPDIIAFLSSDCKHPPPNLVIRNLNLRI